MPKILVVEDEPEMQKGLRDNLKYEGYDVEVVGDGEKGLKKILEASHDLILLDVMLPQMSGFDICRKAREEGITTPIIMLTARGEEIDKVLGLEIGADDYVTKPFSLRELLARVKAVLRRKEGGPSLGDVKVKIGELEVDFHSYVAVRRGKSIDMTSKEFEVLKYLWKNKNRVVTRDALLTDVWGYDETISSRTVDNFVVKLRQKIETSPSKPRHIITFHGTGYKLIP